MAYWVQLPEKLQGIHDVFHVFMLKKYVHDPSHVLSEPSRGSSLMKAVPQRPVAIRQEKQLRSKSKVVPLVKVLWRGSEVINVEHAHAGPSKVKEKGEVTRHDSII